MNKHFILIVAVLVALGRFTVPGHDLTGWPGTYETIAHMFVGALMLTVYQQHMAPVSGYVRMPETRTPWHKRWSVIILFLISTLETVMFFARP